MKFPVGLAIFTSITSLISAGPSLDFCYQTCQYDLVVLPFYQTLPSTSTNCASACRYEKCSTGCAAWSYEYHPNCNLPCNLEFNCVQGCNLGLNYFVHNFSSQISPISAKSDSSNQFGIFWNISSGFVSDYNRFAKYTNWLPQYRSLANSTDAWRPISASNQQNVFSYDGKGHFQLDVTMLQSDGTPISPEKLFDVRVLVSMFDQVTFSSNVVSKFHTEFTQEVIPQPPVIRSKEFLLDQSMVVCWDKSVVSDISQEVELIRAAETVFKTTVDNSSCFVATELSSTKPTTLQLASVTKSGRKSQATVVELKPNSSKLKRKRRLTRLTIATTTGVYLLDNLTNFDVSKPPVLLSSSNPSNPTIGVAANDGFVFVAHQNGLIDRIGFVDSSLSQTITIAKSIFGLAVDWLNEKLYVAANLMVIRRSFWASDDKTFAVPKLRQGSVQGFTVDSINGYLYFSDSICIYRIPLGNIDKDTTECVFKLAGYASVPLFVDLIVDFSLIFPYNNSIYGVRLDTMTLSDLRSGKLRDPTRISYANVVGLQRHRDRIFWIDNRCSQTGVGNCIFGEEKLDTGKLNAHPFLLDPKFGKIIDIQFANISDYPVNIGKPKNFSVLASHDTINISWTSSRLPFQSPYEWRTLNYSIGVQMGPTMLHGARWTLSERYKLNDQTADTKYQILAEVCWGVNRLCSQIVNKSVTTLTRGAHLELIAVSTDSEYQRISATGEILDSQAISIPDNDEIIDLVSVQNDFSYNAIALTKRRKVYALNTANQIVKLRPFTNGSQDVFAVDYDPSGKELFWLSSTGVYSTSLGGNDINLIYKTAVWNPCRWLRIISARAHIIIGCDYTLTAIAFTGAFMQKYHDCNPAKEPCGNLIGFTTDEPTDRIFFLLQDDAGVTLYVSYYSDVIKARAVGSPVSSFPRIDNMDMSAGRIVFHTEDDRIGICPTENLTEINFLPDTYSAFALIKSGANLQVIPDSVRNVAVSVDSDKVLVVSWDPVVKPKDAVVFYNVTVQKLEDLRLMELFITEKSTQRLTKFESSTMLKICVFALTYWQKSEPNCTTHTTPIGDPGMPRNPRIYVLRTRTLESLGEMKTSAIFEWDESNFAGPPGWYRASCTQPNANFVLKETKLPAGLSRMTLDSLPADITISCQVQSVRNESQSAKTDSVELAIRPNTATSSNSHLIVARNDPNKRSTTVTNLNVNTMKESTIGVIVGPTKLAAGIFASREIFLAGDDLIKTLKLNEENTKFDTVEDRISLLEADRMAIDWLGRRLFFSSSSYPKFGVEVWELDSKQMWNISGFAEPVLDTAYDPLTSTLYWTALQQPSGLISLMEMNIGPIISDRLHLTSKRDDVSALRVPNCPPNGIKIISGSLGLKGDIQRNTYGVAFLTDRGIYQFSSTNECTGPFGLTGQQLPQDVNKILPTANDFYWLSKSGNLMNNSGLTGSKSIVDAFLFGPEFQFYPNPNCLLLSPAVPKFSIGSITDVTATLSILESPEFPHSCDHISHPITQYIVEVRRIVPGAKNISAINPDSKIFMNKDTLLTSLIPNSEYDIRVAWQNFYSPKQLQFSIPETIHTSPPRKEPGAPDPPTISKGSIKWKPPINYGGSPVDGYKLQIRKDFKSKWVDVKLQNPNVTEWKAPVDMKAADYAEAQVAAYNSYGYGPFSIQPKSEQTNYIPIIIGVIFGIVVLALIAGVILFVVLRKRNDSPKDLYRQAKPNEMELSNRENNNDRITQLVAKEELDALPHVPRSCITIAKMLGKGAFGEVYEGLACNIPRLGPKTTRVAIKTLRTDSSENERVKFLKEAILMSNFTHANIVKLLGVCLESEPHWLILELMEGGDLLSYLRSVRPNEVMPSQVSLRDLLSMCVDVAKGCEYLEQNHHVHRDLAARNCLITSRDHHLRVVKIADFGLTRDVYEGDYYRVEGQGLLPVRWMAPESMIDGVFTLKTDVWSFGVIMWEVFTLGQQPYMGRTNWDVINYVRIGGTLPSPEFVPATIYEVMTSCWAFQSANRPPFGLVLERLLGLYRHSQDEAEMPFPPNAPAGGYLPTGSRDVSRQSAPKEPKLPSEPQISPSPKESHFVRGSGANQSNNTNKSGRRSLFRSGRKEKAPPPAPPSRAQLEPQSPERLRVPSGDNRPTSSSSSARESYTTNRDGYEAPLVKYTTSNTDYMMREMGSAAVPQQQSPVGNNFHHFGADNLGYEPTSPTSTLNTTLKEDDYEVVNSAVAKVKAQRYTPSPHQSFKSDSSQNSPVSGRKVPERSARLSPDRIGADRVPPRPSRRLTKETTFDAINTAEPETSVNVVDGGEGVSNPGFHL